MAQETKAEQAVKPISTAKPDVQMEGGAAVQEATTSPVVDDVGEKGISVETIALGVLNNKGIVPVGTRFNVAPHAFSSVWMKPLTPEGAEMARAIEQKREDDRVKKQAASDRRIALDLASQLGVGGR